MPKIGDTRKDRALKLVEMIARGPIFSSGPELPVPFSATEASAQYRRWAASWVIDELRALVPELRGEKR